MTELKLIAGRDYLIKQVFKSPAHSAYRRKLLAMGLMPGACLRVKRIAPLGDPIQFEINGFSLSLRRSELCEFLQLEALNDG